MEFEIRIPKHATDLRIRHYKALGDIDVFADGSDNAKIDFICKFLNQKLHQVRLLTTEQIDKVYKYSAMAFSGFKLNPEPPKEITLGGKVFERIDPKKVGVGWHIDMSEASKHNYLEKDPVKLACLFYFPKGELYGDFDKNENLINPIKDRYDLFAEHFMLQTFMESTAFFLTYYAKSKRKLMVQRIAQIKMTKLINKVRSFFGKKPLA